MPHTDEIRLEGVQANGDAAQRHGLRCAQGEHAPDDAAVELAGGIGLVGGAYQFVLLAERNGEACTVGFAGLPERAHKAGVAPDRAARGMHARQCALHRVDAVACRHSGVQRELVRPGRDEFAQPPGKVCRQADRVRHPVVVQAGNPPCGGRRAKHAIQRRRSKSPCARVQDVIAPDAQRDLIADDKGRQQGRPAGPLFLRHGDGCRHDDNANVTCRVGVFLNPAVQQHSIGVGAGSRGDRAPVQHSRDRPARLAILKIERPRDHRGHWCRARSDAHGDGIQQASLRGAHDVRRHARDVRLCREGGQRAR